MFSLKRAALISIQLFVLRHVSAVIDVPYHWDRLVFRGESITITCNTSKDNVTQINWTKDRSVFVCSVLLTQNSSNLTSDRLRIDLNEPLKLKIFNVQPEDAGLYTCTATTMKGLMTTHWNLTVSERPEEAEEVGSSWYFPYMITSVVGVLLCGFASVICVCRKLKARTPNQNQDQVQDQDQLHLESGGEASVPPPHSGTDRRTNNKRRSQYIERLNSIYGCE